MKRMIRFIFVILLLGWNEGLDAQVAKTAVNPYRWSKQQLDSLLQTTRQVVEAYAGFSLRELSAGARDSLLIAKGKELILIYAPDYYREFTPPLVELHEVSPTTPNKQNIGRKYYTVTFFWHKEKWVKKNAIEITIWEDTGEYMYFWYGDWGGYVFDKIPEKEFRKELDTGKIKQIKYNPSIDE